MNSYAVRIETKNRLKSHFKFKQLLKTTTLKVMFMETIINSFKSILLLLMGVFFVVHSNIQAQSLKITKITPTNGAANAEITIYGNGFDATPADNTVTFTPGGGGTGATATVTESSAQHLTVSVPSGLTGGNYNIGVERASDGSTAGTPILFDIAGAGGDFGDPAASENVISNTIDGVTHIEKADIDNDGDQDILFTAFDFIRGEPNVGTVGWIENNGGGNFGSAQTLITDERFLEAVKAVDMDSDGDLDIVSSGGTIKWVENTDGNGTFGSAQALNHSTIAINAMDVDNDGDMDLLGGGDTVSWYENDGQSSPSFTEHQIETNVRGVEDLKLADIDGDDDLDIITAHSRDNKVSWFANNGGGNFFADGVTEVMPADLDGDDDIDILASIKDDGILAWYENDGSGNFGNNQSSSTQKEVSGSVDDIFSVTAADINADGKVDPIITLNSNDKISWFQNNGSGSFGSETIISNTTDRGRHAVAADFNDDGAIDLAAVANGDDEISWFENITTDPIRISKVQPLSGGKFTHIRVYGKDLIGDQSNFELSLTPASGGTERNMAEDSVSNGVLYARIPDDLSGGNYQVSVTRNSDGSKHTYSKLFAVPTSGGDTFSERQSIDNSLLGASSVHAADLDGDGDQDVLAGSAANTVNQDKTIFWYENDGSGSFGAPKSVNDDGVGDAVYPADIDGDGDLDIVSSAGLSWYENIDGNGTFGTRHNLHEVGSIPFAADLDGDGDLDIATPRGWYENTDGSGSFGPRQTLLSDADASDVEWFTGADLDEDGDIDLAYASTTNGRDGNISVIENQGSGSFGSPKLVSIAPEGARSVFAADLTGNNKFDLLSASSHNNQIAWYENDGSGGGTGAGGNGGPTGGQTSVAGATTLNSSDLVFSGIHNIWVNELPTSVDFGAWAVTAADLNGDGDNDVVKGSLEDGKIAWFQNTNIESDRFGGQQVISTTSLRTRDVTTADLDNDGDLDILSASSAVNDNSPDMDNTIGWFENSPPAPATPQSGGRSVDFTDGVITVPQDPSFEDLNAMTVEAWVKKTADSKQQGIIENRSLPLFSSTGWSFHLNFPSNNVAFSSFPGDRGSISQTDLQNNKWYHVAAVIDGDDAKIYVNGKEDTDQGASTSFIFTNGFNGLAIGHLRGATNSRFEGNIENVRLWSTERTPQQIRNHMFESLSGSETGLIGNWKFDEGSGIQVADVSPNNNTGTLSGDVSFSSDTQPFGTVISGSEGWRMMSAPAGNDGYGELLAGLWTQGFTGASSDTGTPNVLTYNALTSNWEPPNNITDSPGNGTGFLVYVYNDQDFDGDNDNFPKPVWTENPREDGEISPSLRYVDDGDGDPTDDGWNFVGNPYNKTIKWSAAAGWTRNNLSNSYYIWNNETGNYQSHNGTAGTLSGDLIAPWQGFWIQANSDNPDITMTSDIQASGGVFLKEEETQVPKILLSLKEQKENQSDILESQAVITFMPEGKIGFDKMDAWKLEPLQNKYLSLYSESSGEYPMDINTLPINFEDKLNIDVDFEISTLHEKYNLEWILEDFPSDWQVKLLDQSNGMRLSLESDSAYNFTVQQSKLSLIAENKDNQKSGNKDIPKPEALQPDLLKTVKNLNTRFTLQVSSSDTIFTNLPDNQPKEIPKSVRLQQNYPNPFNPSTTIRFALPERSQVQLTVYDLMGREVAALVNETKPAGRHSVQFDAANLASGVYIYRLDTGAELFTRKMILIK